MSMVYEPGKSLEFIERVFESADWDAHSQQHLAEMAHTLEKRVSHRRIENGSVHIYERTSGKVTVKMVAGPE